MISAKQGQKERMNDNGNVDSPLEVKTGLLLQGTEGDGKITSQRSCIQTRVVHMDLHL
jgi:hypothetical protein